MPLGLLIINPKPFARLHIYERHAGDEEKATVEYGGLLHIKPICLSR
jgi:hypothetical protein